MQDEWGEDVCWGCEGGGKKKTRRKRDGGKTSSSKPQDTGKYLHLLDDLALELLDRTSTLVS